MCLGPENPYIKSFGLVPQQYNLVISYLINALRRSRCGGQSFKLLRSDRYRRRVPKQCQGC